MIYLDSCILIGMMESPSQDMTEAVAALKSQRQHSIAVSELGRMECLVGCRRAENSALEEEYQTFFDHPSIHFLPINRQVWDRGIALRSQHTAALRIPDALHLATAIEHGCSMFWSFDQRLLTVAEKYIAVFKKI